MILVIGFSNDSTILHTIRRIRFLKVPYIFFDIQVFLNEGEYLWDNTVKEGYLCYRNVRVDFPDSKITGIYVRLIDISNHFEGNLKKKIRAKMGALIEMLQRVKNFTINKPYVDNSNSSKAYHLSILSKCGFRVPASLLTNDQFEALNFLNSYKEAIYKGASSAKTIVSMYSKELQRDLFLIENSPVLFQERIKGVDIRTHLIGDKCYSESIKSNAIDYRFNAGKNKFEKHDIPSEIIKKCLHYQKLSGLSFIGFDFKLTDSGEYIILEANPMPGYDGYDRRLGFKISNELISLLLQGNKSK